MKNIFKIGIVAGLLTLAGCSSNEWTEQAEGLKSFTTLHAAIDDIASTRAHLTDGSTALNKAVTWDEDDYIEIYSDTKPEFTYFHKVSDDGQKAIFNGEKVEGNTFYAIYTQMSSRIDEQNPAIVHATLNNMATNDDDYFFNAPMVAVSTDNNFNLKLTTGLIHIEVGNIPTITEFHLYGNNDERIAGDGYIDMSERNPVFRLYNDGESWAQESEWMKFEGEKQILESGETKDFYFIVPPMTFEKGISIRVKGYDAAGVAINMVKSTKQSLTVERASVHHFSLVDVKATLEEQNEEAVLEAKQRAALIDFYNALNGVNWTHKENWCTDAPLNEWYGVTVDNGKVIGLTLGVNGDIEGEVPASIADLEFVTSFNLQRATLTGQSLTNICALKNLSFLVLTNCEFEEELPAVFYTLENLVSAYFINSLLKGTLSSDISKMTKLTYLNMLSCQLSGTLPQSLATMTNLKYLVLSHNQFSGDVSFLGNMTWLTSLGLAYNNIETIPESIWSLPNLNWLQLSGVTSIPATIGQMTGLTYLSLEGDFTETPSSMANLTKLAQLELYGKLTAIPTWISSLTELDYLEMPNNNIGGELPQWLGNLTKLQRLYLQNNQITGDIPTSFYNLTNLKYLYLVYNYMTINHTEALENWLNGVQYYDIGYQNSPANVEGNEEFGGQNHDWN